MIRKKYAITLVLGQTPCYTERDNENDNNKEEKNRVTVMLSDC